MYKGVNEVENLVDVGKLDDVEEAKEEEVLGAGTENI